MTRDNINIWGTAFRLAVLWITVWLLVFFTLTWALDMKTPVLVFSITLWLSVFADVVYKYFERQTESPHSGKKSLLIVILISVFGVLSLVAISKANPDFLIKNSTNNFQGQQQFIICDFPTGKRISEKIYLSGTTVESEKYNEFLNKEKECISRLGLLKRDQFKNVVVTRNAGTFIEMMQSWLKLLFLPMPLFVLVFSLLMRMLFHKDVEFLLNKEVT